jgi:hypothetical protein
MSKQQLVLVYFGNEGAADEAVNAVKAVGQSHEGDQTRGDRYPGQG